MDKHYAEVVRGERSQQASQQINEVLQKAVRAEDRNRNDVDVISINQVNSAFYSKL